MTTDAQTEQRVRCPSCDSNAKRVSLLTLRALVNDEFAPLIGADQHSCCNPSSEGGTPIVRETGWRFCDATDCDVVYFSEEDGTIFTKSQLKGPVGVKEITGERPLCYCFGHSVASIKDELRAKGRSDALEDIRAKMKDPGCHCETSNPSGSCCLGSVSKGIQIAQEELRMDNSNVTPASTAKSSAGRGEKIAKIGTVISAIMASACCWMPLLLLGVGVSGVGIAATLEAYRPLFIVVTFGFLGAAFYFTYRPKKAAAAGRHDCCATEPSEGEACCPPTGKRRFNMMALNKIMLWVVTGLAVAFLFFPSYVGLLFGTGNQAVVTENMNRAVFQIDGMTCEGCATGVSETLRNLPGVIAVQVDYKADQANIQTPACCTFPKDAVLSAVENAGFMGKVNGEETASSTSNTEQ